MNSHPFEKRNSGDIHSMILIPLLRLDSHAYHSFLDMKSRVPLRCLVSSSQKKITANFDTFIESGIVQFYNPLLL